MPAGQPPADPPETGGGAQEHEYSSDVGIVFEITKSALDMQLRISERLDAKARNYFAFATAVFGAAQALVLRGEVREALGVQVRDVATLALFAGLVLVLALLAAVVAIAPRSEFDMKPAKLRELLTSVYRGDAKAAADGVNLLIGLLDRRQKTNQARVVWLWAVVVLAGLSGLLSSTELVLAVRALT